MNSVKMKQPSIRRRAWESDMQIRFKSTRLKIDWLMLLFPVIAFALGEGASVTVLLISLTAHESAHLIAAKLLGVPISEIRLTPFGGMSRIENLYLLEPPRLACISIAGPAANLLLLFVSSALCHWGLLSAASTISLIRINLLLMLFNLLPALPLDGGRILYAILFRLTSRRRALKIGISAGRALAALLLIFSAYGWFLHHALNLSPVFAALFLLSSAHDELLALDNSCARSLLNTLQPLSGPVPASVIAISEHTPVKRALQACKPGRITLFAVFSKGQLSHFTDDRTLLRRLIDTSPDENQQIF